jgi:pyridoxine 5-phosphate synthase
VRQARRTVEPDPVWAAAEAELGGADCITFHLRQDRRHIQDRDVRLLKQTVRVKLNMEMSMEDEIVAMALDVRPDQATLVPENRQEVTTEGGLDVRAQYRRTSEVTRRLSDAGIAVSAFVDPSLAQVAAARDAGCRAVELHTGRYANASPFGSPARLEELRLALEAGLGGGLVVHAGHGLTYRNVSALAALGGFGEFNIGHAIVSRAVFVGMREAVVQMKRLLELAGRR